MRCNLDRKGRRVRLLWAGLCLAGALALAAALVGRALSGWGWWLVVGLLGANVALGWLGYRRGWCLARSLGFKTPV